MVNRLLITFIVLLLLPPSLTGCAYQNRTFITHLAEYNNKIYIATDDGTLKTYDIKRDVFRNAKKYKDSRITKIMPDNDSLVIETKKIKDDGMETLESIYFMTENEEIINSINVVSPGTKEGSSLTSADDKYVFAISNKLNKKFEMNLNTYRYDKKALSKSENHFDDNSKLLVKDVYEDSDYYWYACLGNASANGWFDAKGTLVVARRDKHSNEQRLIALANHLFERNIYITGDSKNIWVVGVNWYYNNIFKISKEDLTYVPIRITHLNYLIKEIPSINDDDYLWFITLSSEDRQELLYRLNKHDYTVSQIPLPSGSTPAFGPAVVDSDSIWLGWSIRNSSRHILLGDSSPYLLRISKKDLHSEVLPISTTFSEGIGNMTKSFLGYFVSIYVAILISTGPW